MYQSYLIEIDTEPLGSSRSFKYNPLSSCRKDSTLSFPIECARSVVRALLAAALALEEVYCTVKVVVSVRAEPAV